MADEFGAISCSCCDNRIVSTLLAAILVALPSRRCKNREESPGSILEVAYSAETIESKKHSTVITSVSFINCGLYDDWRLPHCTFVYSNKK